MTTSVRFCLSYDCFKLDIVAFTEDNISIENVTLSWTSLWRYIYAEKLCSMWSYYFYDMTLDLLPLHRRFHFQVRNMPMIFGDNRIELNRLSGWVLHTTY